MKENSNLQAISKAALSFYLWCLIATAFVYTPVVHAADESLFYDSSIQRSNFLAIEPLYEKILEEQLKDRRSIFLWKMRFDAQDLSTANNIQSQAVGATVRAKYRYKVLENLTFRAKANMSLESGSSQSIFGDLEPNSGIYPREMKLHWEPWANDYFTIEAGQIHQRFFNEPMFVGNLGFPGIAQELGYSNKRFDISLRTQQLIPTSATLSTRVTEKEEVPNFFTESIFTTVRLGSTNFLKASATHYQFVNLPSIVAYDSWIFGNTVTGQDPKNARFDYRFDGYMGQLAFEQKITNSLAAQIQWHVMKNMAAPDDAGEGQSIKAWVANDFGRWIITGAYVNFFNESDTVPGYYNSHRFGHNNRIGDSFEFNFESKDWGVVFKFNYTRADLLNPSRARVDGIQQDNQQTIYFALETMYDFI